jgi:5-methylcytosine-specific restriction endonuclease McrA
MGTSAEGPATEQLIAELRRLRNEREHRKSTQRKPRGRRLTAEDREYILQKTGGRCHICGDLIEGRWQADHVLAHSGGGDHDRDNFLPAHSLCNNYRWDYLAREFQYILKLGVWLRTQIETDTQIGRHAATLFARYEEARRRRRKRVGG